jgi:hypothetical protein
MATSLLLQRKICTSCGFNMPLRPARAKPFVARLITWLRSLVDLRTMEPSPRYHNRPDRGVSRKPSGICLWLLSRSPCWYQRAQRASRSPFHVAVRKWDTPWQRPTGRDCLYLPLRATRRSSLRAAQSMKSFFLLSRRKAAPLGFLIHGCVTQDPALDYPSFAGRKAY